MKYLGENPDWLTTIYEFPRRESEAIRHLFYALTKTPAGQGFATDSEYQAMIDKAIPLIEQLAALLERGPVRLIFEPVEVPAAKGVFLTCRICGKPGATKQHAYYANQMMAVCEECYEHWYGNGATKV